MTSVEFDKFIEGKPRAFNSSFKAAFAAQEAQQAKLHNPPAPSKPTNIPAPSMQNSFRPAPAVPSSSGTVVNHTSRPAVSAAISAPVNVDDMADIPDSVLEDMDFEKLLEQAEANVAVGGGNVVKMSHQSSSAVSTTTVANYNSHALATPRAALPYTSPPSTSMPPPRNMPSMVAPAKTSKLCHCNLECEVVTISTSMARKKSLVCRQLMCTFVEWVNDYQETAILPAGASYSTPYPNQNVSNYSNDQAYGASGYNGNTSSYNGGTTSYGGNSVPYSYGGDAGQSNPVSNGGGSYDNGGGYSSYDQSYSTSNYGATSNDAYRSALAPISPNTSYNTSYDNNNYRSYPAASSLTPSKPIRNPRVEVQKRFGHREFRPGQWDCIEAALQGRDVFCLMPTGGGKSMVYQLPAWCCAGVTVVFSPLISLIQDQVDALNAMGIRAVCLSQSSAGQDYESSEGRMLLQELRSYHNYSSTPIDQLPPAEQTRIQKEDEQRIKMLYVTPEKFSRSQAVRSLLQQLMHHQLLSRFVLDEAHCLSQWGHDFRPDYLRLADIRALCPSVPIMALTATANQSVVQDIIKILQMKAPFVHTMSFNRPNLQYRVSQKKSEKHTLDEIANYIVNHMQWTGIIYCLSRKDCETLVDDMVALKPALRGKISFYHADLPVQEKEYRQRQWFKGDIRVLCATIAFGMGINKPDVRYVIHLHMPKSLTNYYQESGRAGRDGLPAECILYYSYKDKSRVLSMLDKSQGSYDGQQRQLVSLMKCLDFCLDEVTCRRQLILSYFGETFDATKCKNTCDTCHAMYILRQNFSINGIPLSRLVETHDITHIATLAVHLVMVTTGDGPGGGDGGGGGRGGNGGYRGGRGGNQRYQSNRLPKLTASKLAKLLSGSKGKEVNQYLSSLNELKENLQPLFREQDVYNIHTQYSKEAMEVICHRVIIDGFLREEHVVTNMQGNYGADYLVLGPRAREILDQKQRVYVKFRGSLPTNGYGPNTGITSSVAAKNSKKNSSKSSHSNIVQTNGQLGHGYAQQYNVEDLLSDGPEGDDDDEDPFAPEEGYEPASDVRPATTSRAQPAAPASRRGAAAGSASAAVPVVGDAATATAAVANNASRKRKTSPTQPSKKQKDPYAYLDASDGDDDVDGAFASTKPPVTAKVSTRATAPPPPPAAKHRNVQAHDVSSDGHSDSDNVDDDDGEWGDSEDSAVQRARPPLKKPRTMQPDSVVDLLEDSDAEEVALDPHEVAQRVARRRAAQKELKAAQRQQRRKSREHARPAAATQSAAAVSNAKGAANTQASGAAPGTLMKSSASVYDYGDDAGDDANFFYAAGDDVDEDEAVASNANDVSFSHSSLSNSDQQRQNLSSLSLPGHSTKRALNFDKVGNDGRAEGDEDDDDEDADFEQPSRRTSMSRKSLLSASGSKTQPSKKATTATQQKTAKGKFRTFLDDDEEDEEADEDERDSDSDSDDALAHDEDDDEDDDVAEIALHAFPRRSSAGGAARSKAGLAPLFTQAGGKKGFKPPYASQYSKSEQRQHEAEEAAALEAQRLDAMGDNGLTGRQQDALRVWLQAYRRRWANYWHHLSDASLEYIVTVSIPQTMDEIAEVPGIGESRAMRDGPELLATLGAFMVAQTPPSEKTRLCGLFPGLTRVLPPPGVEEDIIWRDPQSEAAQLKMSSPSARVMPPLPAATSASAAAASSSSRLSFPLASAAGAPTAMSSLLKSPAGVPVVAPSAVVRDGDTFVEHLVDDANGDGDGVDGDGDDDVMMVDDDFAM